MIDALHRRGRYTTITGDGVNDSPSLKRADVGIAMGQNGSDVAKDASELVLTDDNFASIINGIEEGRRIFDNIQKFVLHLLAENVALALTLLIGLVFKDDSNQSVFPIAPVEIIWIIMITSGLPDMGLGMESAAPEVMDQPPQSVSVYILLLRCTTNIPIRKKASSPGKSSSTPSFTESGWQPCVYQPSLWSCSAGATATSDKAATRNTTTQPSRIPATLSSARAQQPSPA